jgi:hypothetical protein
MCNENCVFGVTEFCVSRCISVPVTQGYRNKKMNNFYITVRFVGRLKKISLQMIFPA